MATVQAAGKPARCRVDYPRAAMVVVVCVLAVSCTGRSGPPASARDQQPVSVWPTRGWRTAAPHDEGMDTRVLAGLDDQARLVFPALRSVLVVRHRVLVLERYYHGATQATYFNVFSVTKRVTSADRDRVGRAHARRFGSARRPAAGQPPAAQARIRASAPSPSSRCSP